MPTNDVRQDTLDKITRATGLYAVARRRFHRDHLARLMQRARRLGIGQEQVIARAALPRREAERLLTETDPRGAPPDGGGRAEPTRHDR